MSVKVSSWVWHETAPEINGNELILLLALADIADDSGRCRFVADESALTYESLGRKARISKSTVIRLVASLRDRGLVDQVKGVKGRPNEFRVLVPWAAKSGVNLEPKASEADEDSVSTREDSVSNATTFGVNSDERSSLLRIDVSKRGGAAKRGTRIPDPFEVTPAMVSWAKEHAPLVDGRRSTERFINYWTAKTGRDATKLDWVRTWRNWLLKDQEDAERRGAARLSPTDRALATIALGQEPQRAVGA